MSNSGIFGILNGMMGLKIVPSIRKLAISQIHTRCGSDTQHTVVYARSFVLMFDYLENRNKKQYA